MNKNKISYKSAGVDIDVANDTKKEMSLFLNQKEGRVLNKLGAFASLYDVSFPEIKNPVLVLKTEEPGSKQILSFKYDRVESICYDMINHLINDCIVMGARPLSVQDAIICGKLDKKIVLRAVKAISEACGKQGCVLTGGETSEQPGVLNEGEYILTSSIVGIVDKQKVIDGSKISKGNKIIALESSGPHTNGYSLLRQLINKKPEIISKEVAGRTFLDAILEPHRCYYSILKDLFNKDGLVGMAHITGGGIKENLNRILPENISAFVDLSKLNILPVFKTIKEEGNISDSEMIRTFNLGVGMVLVVDPNHVEKIILHIRKQNINCYEIGNVNLGNGEVHLEKELVWS